MNVIRTHEEKLTLIRALHVRSRYNEWESDSDFFYDNIGHVLDDEYLTQDELAFTKSCYEKFASWLVNKDINIIHHSAGISDDVRLEVKVVDHHEDRVIIYIGQDDRLTAQEINEIERVPVSVEAIVNFDELRDEYEKEVQHPIVDGIVDQDFERSILKDLASKK